MQWQDVVEMMDFVVDGEMKHGKRLEAARIFAERVRQMYDGQTNDSPDVGETETICDM